MIKKIIIIILVLVFVATISLVLVGAIAYRTGSEKGEEIGFQKGWQAADKRLEETGFVSSLAKQVEIKSIRGEALEINGRKIKVKIKPLLPLADPDLDIRIVEVSGDTEIFQSTKIKSDIAPKGYVIKEIEVDISAVKSGQFIMVGAEENIRDKKEFKANWITLLYKGETEIMF